MVGNALRPVVGQYNVQGLAQLTELKHLDSTAFKVDQARQQ